MGRGGMRFGAGRPGWKRKAELSLAFDIREVAGRGLLVPGTAFNYTWTNSDGKQPGTIGVRITDDAERVIMSYQWSVNGSVPQSVDCSIAIARTACFYGGNRPWFLCPKCGRRCGVLYFSGRGAGLYECRDCVKVTYASQCEDSLGRTWIKQSKIEARLVDGWHRPKGMHRKTYERLYDAVAGCDQKRNLALMSVMQLRLVSMGQ